MPGSRETTEQIDWRAEKSSQMAGVSEIRSVEKLETLLAVQIQRHHTIDRSRGDKEPCKKKGSARPSSSQGQERIIVRKTNIGTISKVTWGKFLETEWRAHGLSRSPKYHIEMN